MPPDGGSMRRTIAVQLVVLSCLLGTAAIASAQYYGGGGGAAASPTAVTGPATNVTSTAALLNGTVNPAGGTATYAFEVGLAAGSYTSTSGSGTVSGTTAQAVSAALTGLTPGTTYHYRVRLTKDGVTI